MPGPVEVVGTAVTAWWLIDPASGMVRDEHENGRHAEGLEYSSGTTRALSTMECFRRPGGAISRPLATAALVLFLATGASPASPLCEPLSELAEAATAAREREAARKAAEQAACGLG